MARARDVRLPLTRGGAFILALFGLTLAPGCGRASVPVVLATTSSVANSGLLDAVLPEYRAEIVRPVLVGSGRALDMLAAASADVVISHAPLRETAALATHPNWTYRKILYNDFVIAGPPEDPAAVDGATSAVEAMSRIAASGARFLSRGDESGTHEREQELWSAAGMTPGPASLVIAGAGMGQTLRIAGSSGAYTLTDRGTFEALRAVVTLRVLHEGDPVLLNTYAVIADPTRERGAAFARWLSLGDGLQVLAAALRHRGIKGFSVWPEDVDGSAPTARPR